MVPVAFIGWSGSGKTTQILRLVRHYAARGERIAVIKHTHHPLTGGKPGDTESFASAGASETILASTDGYAIHSDGEVFRYEEPSDLLGYLTAQRVLVEGFKDARHWPAVLVGPNEPPIGREGLVAVIAENHDGSDLPCFRPDSTEEIARFLDTMQRSMAASFDAVVFDLDGTLIDSYGALARAINHARGASGLPELPEIHIRAAVGEGIERLLEQTFAPTVVPAGAREAFEAHYDQICCEESRVLENVRETLGELQANGIAMAVCTNKPTAFSAKILEYLSLARRFRAIVGPDLAGARKPDGRHVRFTLDRLGAAARSPLFVGDMPIDVAAARDAGLPVAVLATGSSTRETLAAAGPDYLLDNFHDLVDLVVPRRQRRAAR